MRFEMRLLLVRWYKLKFEKISLSCTGLLIISLLVKEPRPPPQNCRTHHQNSPGVWPERKMYRQERNLFRSSSRRHITHHRCSPKTLTASCSLACPTQPKTMVRREQSTVCFCARAVARPERRLSMTVFAPVKRSARDPVLGLSLSSDGFVYLKRQQTAMGSSLPSAASDPWRKQAAFAVCV